MNENKNKKYIYFCLGLVLVCFFAYQYWTSAEATDSQLISTNKVNADFEDETLQILSELRTLTLDEDIFNDKAFVSLEDFSMEIKSQPVGRNNPFAPIGTDGTYTDPESEEGVPTEEEVDTPVLDEESSLE